MGSLPYGRSRALGWCRGGAGVRAGGAGGAAAGTRGGVAARLAPPAPRKQICIALCGTVGIDVHCHCGGRGARAPLQPSRGGSALNALSCVRS